MKEINKILKIDIDKLTWPQVIKVIEDLYIIYKFRYKVLR